MHVRRPFTSCQPRVAYRSAGNMRGATRYHEGARKTDTPDRRVSRVELDSRIR